MAEEKRYFWNFPEERMILDVMEFPTLLSIPEWDVIRRPAGIKVGPLSLPPLPPRPATVTNLSVNVVGDYNERDLLRAPTSPDAPVTLSYDSIKEYAETIAPIEDPAVVEWMHYSAAEDLICEMVQEEYRRAGSDMIGAADDAYIPGCRVEDIRYNSERGRAVTERGNGVVSTPRGNFNVPVAGKATGIFEDMLCFGAISNAWLVQWAGTLLKWKNLATNPQSRIRFPSFRGLVAPQFIGHEADMAFPTNYVSMGVSSDKAQTLKIVYREPSDYRQEITSINVDVPKGQNEVGYTLLVFPYVPTMVAELQPENDTSTILNSYSVSVP